MAVALRMHNPLHPREILRQLCLEPLGLTVTEAAEGLGVSRKTLSAILNGRASVSPEMAVRLSLAFGTSAESWLNHQLQYDLWQVQKQRKNLRNCRFGSVSGLSSKTSHTMLLLGPAGLPEEVVSLLNREVAAIMQDEGVRSTYAITGADPVYGSVEHVRALIARETELNVALINALEVKPQ